MKIKHKSHSECFKDLLAEHKYSPRKFYNNFIARKVPYTKTGYKSFLADLNKIGMKDPYIIKATKEFEKSLLIKPK